jgi:hypothetical protein
VGFDDDLPGPWARPTPRPAKAVPPPWPDSRLAADLRWFLGHLDTADTPIRIHRHGVWVDVDGLGSLTGSPALDPAFERWLLAGEWDRVTVRVTVECFHVARAEGTLCEVCGVRDVNGLVVAEANVRQSAHELYRWPMRAAIGRLDARPWRAGRPRLSSTLFVLAAAAGDLDLTSQALARRYPAMADEATALTHFALALRRVRHIWSEEAPPRRDRPNGLVRSDEARGIAS